MAELYSFFDPVEIAPGVYDREYSAPEFTDFFKGLITTGIMKGQFTELKVTASGSNMVTEIDTGVAYIEGKRYANTTKKAMTHDTETLGKSRIDRIVIRMDESIEARYVRAFIKKGVASTNPIPPTLTQTPNLYEISLAQVKIVGGQTYIAVDDVTDERGKDVICPYAGSNILPNFNQDGLQQVLDKVDNMYSVTDSVGRAKDYYGDLDDLVTSGLYYVGENTPNAKYTTRHLVEVIASEDSAVQLAYNTANNHPTLSMWKRHGKKNIETGIIEYWPEGKDGWPSWRRVDTQLTDSLRDRSSTTSASAKAVSDLYDEVYGPYIDLPPLSPFRNTGTCRLIKNGKIVIMAVNVTPASQLTTSNIYQLCDYVPVGYRPRNTAFGYVYAFVSPTVRPIPVTITPYDGMVIMQNPPINIPAGYELNGFIVYYTDQ